MNPDTNRFEKLHEGKEISEAEHKHTQEIERRLRQLARAEHERLHGARIAEHDPPPSPEKLRQLLEQVHTDNQVVQLMRPNGEPVPAHWSVFAVGELVVIKNYTFRVAYIGETAILFEPVGPTVLPDLPDGE